MFKRISLLNKRGFLQKKENFDRGFLFTPLLIIPLFLVIISGFLIKSIQGDLLVSNYLSHILTGFLCYFLAFFISYIPLERIRKYIVPFYLFTFISLLLIYFFGISVSGAQRWLNLNFSIQLHIFLRFLLSLINPQYFLYALEIDQLKFQSS